MQGYIPPSHFWFLPVRISHPPTEAILPPVDSKALEDDYFHKLKKLLTPKGRTLIRLPKGVTFGNEWEQLERDAYSFSGRSPKQLAQLVVTHCPARRIHCSVERIPNTRNIKVTFRQDYLSRYGSEDEGPNPQPFGFF